jgi:hypothetical protein
MIINLNVLLERRLVVFPCLPAPVPTEGGAGRQTFTKRVLEAPNYLFITFYATVRLI